MMTGRTLIRTPFLGGFAAVVEAVIALLLVNGSAAHAQTSGSGQSGGSASAGFPKSSLDAQEEVRALLAQVGSLDRGQREQAAGKLQQMHGTLGKQVLESVKQQVAVVREERKKYDDVADKLTPAEQSERLSAVQQKATVASESINLLGKMHVEEAIPFLLKNIQFVSPEQRNDRWNYPDRFPCLGALIALGPPAADAALRVVEEEPIQNSAFWGEELLVRTLRPHGAAGYLQDRIDLLKERQKALSPASPVAVTPGKLVATPISMRIARLEAVRTHIEANAKDWVRTLDFLNPNTP